MMELKPCPFCGGEAEYAYMPKQKKIIFRKLDMMTYVRCNCCLATSSVKYTEENARMAWNRRAT